MQKPPRPTGVTILAILDFIAGILLLLVGAILAAVGGSSILNTYGYGAMSGLVSVLGGALAIAGVFALVVGWGLWVGKGWAWTLDVVLSALGIVFSVLGLFIGQSGNIVSIVVDALVLWYLYKPHVKAYFGKGMPMAQPAPAMQAPPAPTQ